MERKEDYRLDNTPWYAQLVLKTRTTGLIRRQDTGEPVLLPFRMSAFVLSNLIVTGGMLTPNLSVRTASTTMQGPD